MKDALAYFMVFALILVMTITSVPFFYLVFAILDKISDALASVFKRLGKCIKQ